MEDGVANRPTTSQGERSHSTQRETQRWSRAAFRLQCCLHCLGVENKNWSLSMQCANCLQAPQSPCEGQCLGCNCKFLFESGATQEDANHRPFARAFWGIAGNSGQPHILVSGVQAEARERDCPGAQRGKDTMPKLALASVAGRRGHQGLESACQRSHRAALRADSASTWRDTRRMSAMSLMMNLYTFPKQENKDRLRRLCQENQPLRVASSAELARPVASRSAMPT